MMKWAVLALLLGSSPLAAQTLYVKQTEDGYLNLRSGPGTRYEVLDRLAPGDRVVVQETVGRWYRVVSPGGDKGWVAGDFLERVGDGRTTLFVKQTGDGYLNLRSGPATSHDILRRMYPGDRLEPLERSGDWIRVRHVSGAVGWAHGSYIRD